MEGHREKGQSSHQTSDLGLDSWGRWLRGPQPEKCYKQGQEVALGGP